MKIGMIGLGAMGMPIAQNLVRADMEVSGYDTVLSQVEAFIQRGGRWYIDDYVRRRL